MDQHGDRLALYRRPQVLVAHGERLMREGLAGILRRAGYDVDEAGDAEEALVLLDKCEVKALVVSVRLPPDGHLALLAARGGSAPIVLIGGSDDDVAGLTGDRAACNQY